LYTRAIPFRKGIRERKKEGKKEMENGVVDGD